MSESLISYETLVSESFRSHAEVINDTLDLLHHEIIYAAESIADCLLQGGKLYLCGNGGSDSQCHHLAGELLGRFRYSRRPLPAIALSSDSSVLTCISNDFDYNQIFSRQIEALTSKEDLLMCFSTSGNSKNVINAIVAARDKKLKVIGFLGMDGGTAKDLCDVSIVVPSSSTARIQEAHLLLLHILCDIVERRLGVISSE